MEQKSANRTLDFTQTRLGATHSTNVVASPLENIEKDLERLESRLIGYIQPLSSVHRDILEHLFASRGKRIRPALFYMCSQLVRYEGDHLDPIAAVCEFVHTASLLHDDVVDNAKLRRCKPTARTIWGDQSSVLVGDLIYARASQMMADTGSLEVVKTFAEAIRLMSEGELLQLDAIFDIDATIASYLRVIDYKTGALLSASCRAAGLLADHPLANELADFGLSLGKAFQIVDDALDIQGSSISLGKVPGGDLREGKMTLPFLMFRERTTPGRWIELVSASAEGDESAIQALLEGCNEFDCMNSCYEVAQSYTDDAVRLLKENFPDSDARRNLVDIAELLTRRTK